MSQATAFYTKNWTVEIEKTFIDILVENSVGRVYMVPDYLNAHAISGAMGVVNSTFGTSFTYDYCVGRAMRLRERYRVFKWIKGLAGVIYDSDDNSISAPQSVWDYICRKEKLGYAYMFEGDADFDELEKLFGDPANADDESEIIDKSKETQESGSNNSSLRSTASNNPFKKTRKP